MSVAEVYASHRDAVQALARRQLGDPVDADDIAAATFSLLLTIQGPHTRGQRGPEVRAFVLGVCANVIRRFRRARARRRDVLARYHDEACTSVDDVERTAASRELAARLVRALESLPEEQRTAVMLSAIEGHSAAEIAQHCGIPEATARTRLFHARKKLRLALAPPRAHRRRLVAGACSIALLAFIAVGPRALAERIAAAGHAVLQAMGIDRGKTPHFPSAPFHHYLSPPPHAITPPPPHAITPPPPTIAPARAVVAPPPRRRAPATERDRSDADYVRAHREQFVSHDYDAALRAWDAYLGRARAGSFVLEARYNRAIALAQLGRVAEARAALQPFADGVYGDYRRHAAARLLLILPGTNKDTNDSLNDQRPPSE
jgi:RNA polymerase sigma-70 factor (ECF subfamily)